MFAKFLGRARAVTGNLSRLDSQPIGWAAFTIVILLDIFILASLFDGLVEHTRQLTSPSDYVPARCQTIVLDRDWNATDRLVNLAEAVSAHQSLPARLTEKPHYDRMQPVCARLERQVCAVFDFKALSGSLTRYLQMRRESVSARAELERVKGAYDTSLLEKLAEQGTQRQTMMRLGEQVRNLSDRISALSAGELELESALSGNPLLVGLFRSIDAVTDAEREQVRRELQHRNFWFPVRRLGMEMLFLFPLLLVFYTWNVHSLSRGRPYQVLVSSHLLVVTFIPVLSRIVQLVYDIIPRKLLKHVIDLLESLQLVALWYYLLIGMAVLAALAVIYLFQKKLFSHDRLAGRRIAKGQCQECGMRLPAGAAVCPLCGYHQYRKCSSCGQDTYVHGRYCRVCGQEEPVSGVRLE
jgi:Double zinc ribbon